MKRLAAAREREITVPIGTIIALTADPGRRESIPHGVLARIRGWTLESAALAE